MHFPPVPVPLIRIFLLIAIVGFGLAMIHPILAAIGIVGIGFWVRWRYFFPLVCESCNEYFLSGLFSNDEKSTIPWAPSDTNRILKAFIVTAVIFAGLFLILYFPYALYTKKCVSNCQTQGLQMKETRKIFSCECTSTVK